MSAAPTWLDEFFGPAGTPLANAETGSIHNITTTRDGISPQAGVRFTGAAPTATGFAGGTTGRRIVLMTVGGPLVLANANAGSLAANRIVTGTGGNLTIGNGGSVLLVYDLESTCWRVAMLASAIVAAEDADGTAVIDNASTGTLNNVISTSGADLARAVRHTGVAPTINGYASGASGRRLIVEAVGGPLTLANQAAASTDTNRIITGTGASVAISEGAAALLVYDATTARWRYVGVAGTGEANTSSNLGATGSSWASAKVGVDLPFRKAIGTSPIVITQNTNDCTFSLDTVPVANGGTGITAIASGMATFWATPTGANLAATLTSALPYTKGGTGLTALGTTLQYLRTNAGVTAVEWATLSVAIGDVTGLGANVATFLATPTGANLASALSTALPVTKGGTGLTAVGTALQLLRTNAGATAMEWWTLGVAVGDITGLGSGVATALATFSSANIKAACTDETGSGGALVFATSPTLTTPTLADPSVTGTVTHTHSATSMRELAIPGGATTTSTAQTTLQIFNIEPGTTVRAEFTAAMGAVDAANANAAAGGYSGSVTYRRDGSAAPAIAGAVHYSTPERVNESDTCLWVLATNTIYVKATAADADERNWVCTLRIVECTNT